MLLGAVVFFPFQMMTEGQSGGEPCSKLPSRGNGRAGTGPRICGAPKPFPLEGGTRWNFHSRSMSPSLLRWTWPACSEHPRWPPWPPGGRPLCSEMLPPPPSEGLCRGPPAIPAVPLGPHGALTSPGNCPQPPQPGLPPKVKHGISIRPLNSTPGHRPERGENRFSSRTRHTSVHSSEQPRCPWADEWISTLSLTTQPEAGIQH